MSYVTVKPTPTRQEQLSIDLGLECKLFEIVSKICEIIKFILVSIVGSSVGYAVMKEV